MVDHVMHKLPWLRLSYLGAIALMLVFPWLTTTGCDGDKQPVTYSGLELVTRSFTSEHNAVLALGPAVLLVVALVAFARIARPGLRLAVDVVALVLSLGGLYATLLAIELPTVAEHTVHHPAAALSISLMLAFLVDGGARVFLSARELWRARRTRHVVTRALRVSSST